MQLSNRMVKDDFWTDTELMDNLPPTGRMFYQGLWQLAESSGVVEHDITAFKIQLFPLDGDITKEDLQKWTEILIELDKLIPYTAEGKDLLYIKNFHKHQSLRNPGQPQNPLPKFIRYLPNSEKRKSGWYLIDYGVMENGQLEGKELVGSANKDFKEQWGDVNDSLRSDQGDEREREREREREVEHNVPDQESGDNSPKYPEGSKPLQLARRLRNLIRENNQYQQLPDDTIECLQGWADSLRKMHEYGMSANDDGDPFTWEQIEYLIDWSQQDKFWHKNILSAPKLRQKAGQLISQIKEKGKSNGQSEREYLNDLAQKVKQRRST